MRIERFLEEKLSPIYRAHYVLWVWWWPLWRGVYTGRNIRRKWRKLNLVNEGQSFLDYGCGTGDFTIPAAKIVGRRGEVYALDCFPRQLKIVERKARKEELPNIKVILSDKETGLPDESIDVIWMCDVLHEIKEKRAVLEELHRVLRGAGVLAIHDGMRDEVLDYTNDLFHLTLRDDKLSTFIKIR